MTPEPLDPVDAPAEEAEEEPGPTKLERAADVARALVRHKQLLVAAMEMIRERGGLTEEEEVKIVSAYETGTVAARAALSDLVEKLQQAKLGRVAIALAEQVQPGDLTPDGVRAALRPTLAAAREEIVAEAKPYIERALLRFRELKALEAPTIAKLENISSNLKDASKTVAEGLRGAGREAADELVRRGKRWWMSPETEELEREFFDWTLKAIPRAERKFVRILTVTGLILVVSGLLLAAQEAQLLEKAALYATIVLLIFVGLWLISTALKVSKAMQSGRGQFEALARMTPQERRLFLTKRWTERAQDEGVITSQEADTVIEQTLNASQKTPATSFVAALRAARR